MPTVLRIGRYRFHFFSDEANEPVHIHVRTAEGECKFWLQPIGLARNRGIRPHDLRDIERLIFEHRTLLIAKYNEYHARKCFYGNGTYRFARLGGGAHDFPGTYRWPDRGVPRGPI